MDYDAQYWVESYRGLMRRRGGDDVARREEIRRARWDERAPEFAKPTGRSDSYAARLVEALRLSPGDSLFDMGCGPGTIAIPVAMRGHHVIAVDFSQGMLNELEKRASAAGCIALIEPFQRSWNESWEGLPTATVALSSRSFGVDDIADGIAKLESKATERVAISLGAGDYPFRDQRIFKAMGRENEPAMPARQMTCVLNYLLSIGRFPEISYIAHRSTWGRPTREELVAHIEEVHAPQTAEESRRLGDFLDTQITFNEESQKWEYPLEEASRFAVIQWPVLR